MTASRFVLDSNVVDGLLADYDVVREAVTSCRVELLWTHVTVDELSAVTDPARRAHLLNVAASLCRFVPTAVFVLDYSRLGMARLNDDVDAFEALRRGNLKHTRDAIIAATAVQESATLVTADAILTKTAVARRVDVIAPVDLVARCRP